MGRGRYNRRVPRKKRLFTGFQPTGELHIGNYLGAIANAVRLTRDYEAIFSVVDYHAITVEYDPAQMRDRVFKAAAMLMASGLTPDRCTLFVQSAVPEHTELAWILSTVTGMGELERMTQYKDKSKDNTDNINAGLFTYPVLQAADILLYKAEAVPVGDDQAQHLELSREIVRRFNRHYGNVFPEPATLLTEVPRVLGLDGKRKMSKSLGNYVGLSEKPEETWKKLSTAVTDENRKRRTDPGNPDVCNIFTLHRFFTGEADRRKIDADCRTAAIGCIDCKKTLAAGIEREIGPVRARYEEYLAAPGTVWQNLETGAARCRAIARGTMTEVRKALGLP